MIKKVLSFVFCLAPIGAMAASPYVYETETGASYDANLNLINMYIGQEIPGAPLDDNYYVGPNAGTNTTPRTFSIRTDANLTATGTLNIASTHKLAIDLQTPTSANKINATFGNILADGRFDFRNIGAFKSGTVDSAVGFDLNAQSVDMTDGAIDVAAGDTNITSAGGMTVAQISNGDATSATGGTMNITAGSLVVGDTANAASGTQAAANFGDVQNYGTMNVELAGNLTTAGSIENKSGNMTIERQVSTNVVNVVVNGAVTNEAGLLTMAVDSLRINGGDTNNNNASFVNKGDLYAVIKGETFLSNGFDLSAMYANNANTFHLDTGTLVYGAGATADSKLQVSTNNLSEFFLAVRGGDFTAGAIDNGSVNANANMTLVAQNITADSVNNAGTLNIGQAGDSTLQSVTINHGVQGKTGSTTNIIAAGAVDITESVSNSGTMLINGNDIDIANVSNDGTSLRILSLTDAAGSIKIGTGASNGNVANNSGAMRINAKDIEITGTVTSAGGTTTIRGSDANGNAVTMAGLAVNGGTVNLNALAGSVNVGNNVIVATNGALNLGSVQNAEVGTGIHNLNAAGSVLFAGDVTVGGADATGGGNVNIALSDSQAFTVKADAASTATDAAITIDGSIRSTQATNRTVVFDADRIKIGQDVVASGQNVLKFGNDVVAGNNFAGNMTVGGDVSAKNGATVEIFYDDVDVGSMTTQSGKVIAHGTQITADGANGINIGDSLWMNGTNANGLIVTDNNSMALRTTASGADIVFGGGMSVGTGKTLTMTSADAASVGGVVENSGNVTITAANGAATFGNQINNNAGEFNVSARSIDARSIKNNAVLSMTASGDIRVGDVVSTADTTIKSNGGTVTAGAFDVSQGVTDVSGRELNSTMLAVYDAGRLNIDAQTVNVRGANGSGNIYVGFNKEGAADGAAMNLVQGGAAVSTGMLNILANNATVSADNLNVSGRFLANGNAVDYRIANSVNIAQDVTVASGADVDISAGNLLSVNDVTNDGTLKLAAANGMDLGTVISRGDLTLDSGVGISNVDSFTIVSGSDGRATLAGAGMNSGGIFTADGILYQNYMGTTGAGDVNVLAGNYVINASNVKLGGINQKTGSMTLNSSDVNVAGDINAVDLRIAARPSTNWLNVDVGGSVSGGVQFIGVEHMKIGGNYTFDNNSQINAALLPYAAGTAMNTTPYNYWATISTVDDKTLGQITNPADAAPLISVGGKFVSNVTGFGDGANGGALDRGQIGLTLYDIVDQGTAIWFVHADGGLEELGDKIRNLNVNFCNADGSLCFNYLDSLQTAYNKTGEDLPAYVSVRDSDGDGETDSLYIVFDPRFGGPVEVFKIQPIVGREEDHTKGEYVSAGALDNLIAGQLHNKGFYNRTPIEAIPLIFKGTNLQEMSQQLYNRMEYYNLNRDGTGLARFSRLFQAREIEQIAGAVSLNEHTNFRTFEDRMFDEFIWNRNRNLRKAWADVDFGMFYQDASDGKHVDGNRFSVSGGYDWQESETLILGLTGRVSHLSSDNSDTMDLGYLPGQHIAGRVDTTVADTNIGLGGYLMKTFGNNTRLYGNGFLDIHVFDVERTQNYVNKIDGSGSAFALLSEWGLLHDWLNQYVVGNAYARVGYNFGFSVTEKVGGRDYMKLKSDGYFVLTPGYSLTAQKRIYPSSWFQIRPYASIGVEYDVLGAPDDAKYKFALAHSFTKYDIDIDPLWANIGGGVELLSARGIQVGLDYRYQYNEQLQLHNIKISGSYRF